jgi:hypothetical protein
MLNSTAGCQVLGVAAQPDHHDAVPDLRRGQDRRGDVGWRTEHDEMQRRGAVQRSAHEVLACRAGNRPVRRRQPAARALQDRELRQGIEAGEHTVQLLVALAHAVARTGGVGIV